MKVGELVKHLQMLPQDLTVVGLWDEGGTYHDTKYLPQEIDIVKSNHCMSYGGKEWTDIYGYGERQDNGEWAEEIIYEKRHVVKLY